MYVEQLLCRAIVRLVDEMCLFRSLTSKKPYRTSIVQIMMNSPQSRSFVMIEPAEISAESFHGRESRAF